MFHLESYFLERLTPYRCKVNRAPASYKGERYWHLPILKKGKSAETASSYRSIALASIFSKIYERLVLGYLQKYLDRYNFLYSEEAGFRNNIGTTEQVLRLTQEIVDCFHHKQSALAIFIDFKTAFDRVYRTERATVYLTQSVSCPEIQIAQGYDTRKKPHLSDKPKRWSSRCSLMSGTIQHNGWPYNLFGFLGPRSQCTAICLWPGNLGNFK